MVVVGRQTVREIKERRGRRREKGNMLWEISLVFSKILFVSVIFSHEGFVLCRLVMNTYKRKKFVGVREKDKGRYGV